ncbi:hypothetical protein BJQ90_03962 [Arthrobacter sp. SO3]|nr:hypothetical protein [Arthrobacter sp. SO3]
MDHLSDALRQNGGSGPRTGRLTHRPFRPQLMPSRLGDFRF